MSDQTQSRFSRFRKSRILGLSIALATAAIVGFAAILFFTSPLDGSLEVPDEHSVNWDSGTPTVTNNGPIQCEATITGVAPQDRVLSVTATNAWPESSCDITHKIIRLPAGGSAIRVQDIVFNGTGVSAYFPTNGCDVTIADGASTTPTVTFRLEILPDAQPGTITASADAGLKSVLATEWISEDCPTGP